MKKQADYIKRIEIKSLWGRKDRDIVWNLRPDVNILSGINGIGKSTILNKSIHRLNSMVSGELKDYQVNIGNRIIELLSSGEPDAQVKAAEVSLPKKKFQDIIDDLFSETGKKILRKSNEIAFEQVGETLYPHQLSSGEKQILAILLTVLIQDNQHFTLFMDEPEVSLHIEWQQRLISLIMNGWMDAVTEVSDITESLI